MPRCHSDLYAGLALLCGWLWGCASEPVATPPDDRATYAAALDVARGTPYERLEWCQTITASWMRHDCSLAVVQPMALHSLKDAEGWCPHAGPEKWRDECIFGAAESAATRGDSAAAKVLCERAGVHQGSCHFHLFQIDMERMVWEMSDDPVAVQTAFDDLVERHGRSTNWPGVKTSRQNWYGKIALRYEILDDGWCNALSDSHRSDCRIAVRTRLHSVAQRNPASAGGPAGPAKKAP